MKIPRDLSGEDLVRPFAREVYATNFDRRRAPSLLPLLLARRLQSATELAPSCPRRNPRSDARFCPRTQDWVEGPWRDCAPDEECPISTSPASAYPLPVHG